MKINMQIVSGGALFLIGISLDFIFNLIAAEIKVQVWYDENRAWILMIAGVLVLVGIILIIGNLRKDAKLKAEKKSNVSSDMPIFSEDEKYLREQLACHQENHRQLLKQKSTYAAGEEPLYLLNQIAAEEKAIKEIEQQLRK